MNLELIGLFFRGRDMLWQEIIIINVPRTGIIGISGHKLL